ncbi:hypothetical protein [Geothrix fermentans]|uniref:hypothetical protein n=1 Tax=Geothrix fermentans TaxID=44676 RepID=UPI00047CB101|nr:hypothetical protein [Geothrix fermentans]
MRLLVALLAMTPLLGQAPKIKPASPPATQIETSVHQLAPRYQLIQLGEFRSDQYLLDTHTGRMWQMVKSKEGSMVLQMVPFIDPLDEQVLLPNEDLDSRKFAYRIQILKESEKLLGVGGAKKSGKYPPETPLPPPKN